MNYKFKCIFEVFLMNCHIFLRTFYDFSYKSEILTADFSIFSLLKAHLEFKKYTVRVGSDRPTSGDDALFNIKQAKNFLLVLTDESLHGCIGDDECNNWMHKVTVVHRTDGVSTKAVTVVFCR